jgi:hypothetical protein
MSHKLITEAFGVTLKTEQEEEATEVCHEYALRELVDFKIALLELERNPEPLLELMLASGARYRDAITEEAPATRQHGYAKSIGNLLDPPDDRSSKRLWERNATGDATLRKEMEDIFTPDQLQLYQERIEEHDASQNRLEPHGLVSMRGVSLKNREVDAVFQTGGIREAMKLRFLGKAASARN